MQPKFLNYWLHPPQENPNPKKSAKSIFLIGNQNNPRNYSVFQEKNNPTLNIVMETSIKRFTVS